MVIKLGNAADNSSLSSASEAADADATHLHELAPPGILSHVLVELEDGVLGQEDEQALAAGREEVMDVAGGRAAGARNRSRATRWRPVASL